MSTSIQTIEKLARQNQELFLSSGNDSYFYSSGSFCNTKKEQGLFSVKYRDDFFVLLSSLDETIRQNGNEFHLAHHRYQGAQAPTGNKYISSQLKRIPECETKYCMGNVALLKRIQYYEKQPILLIEYTLEESYAPIELNLSPFLAFRWANSLRHCHTSYFNVAAKTKKVRVSSPNCPTLYIHSSKAFQWNPKQQWHKNFEYIENSEPQSFCYEDLMQAGEMLYTMQAGDRVLLALSTQLLSQIKTFEYYMNRKNNKPTIRNHLGN